jgi:hypothetical protein
LKLHMFLKWTPSNIKTHAFSMCVVLLWFTNINIQFILNPYVVASYCTSCMTKIDKSITLKLHSIIEKCNLDKVDVNTRIHKLSNVFFNAQQMYLTN